jgi:hypothetical protein
LGFVWAGDAGFWGAFNNTTGANSPVSNASPLNPKLTSNYPNSGVSGNQQIYNGQFLMNFVGYAIKYAGTHKRQ